MILDHLLARDALGTPLDDDRHARAVRVLAAFGFESDGEGGHALGEGYAYATVTPDAGLLRVPVRAPVPTHLVEALCAALEGLVLEAGLARIDLFTRGELPAGEWARRVASLPVLAPRR